MTTATKDSPYWAVIEPDGKVVWHTGAPTITDLQAAVGGWIELVPGPRDFVAYCNEEGKLDGLPFNEAATRFTRIAGQVLVGPVVVIGPTDRKGNETPLPAAIRQRLAAEVIEA